jgi:butyrate kinase
MAYKLLVINPGSTSTKISVYNDNVEVFDVTLRHTAAELDSFTNTISQLDFRKDVILSKLEEEKIALDEFDAIIGRGGMVQPLESGTYVTTDKLLNDLKKANFGEHASNLGGVLASEIASVNPGCKSFISDPVVVDEFEEISRITGHPLLPKRSAFHALNQKATARIYAREVNKNYEDLNLVVCHMGGGISVGVHRNGKIIDVNNCIDGSGPFSPERAGTLPAGSLARLCFSGEYTLNEVMKMINGKGGLMAHLGENQAHHIQAKAEAGDKKADLILSAMAYNIAKEIGSATTVLKGKVDAILLTGGIAYNDFVVSRVVERIEFLAPVKRYPGEDEMGALASNVLRVLNNEEQCKVY